MIRQIIHIDQDLCNGCGLCVDACHEGAIGMVDGKATLLRDDYCDGLGNCLPVCPTGALSFEEREADEYDEAAVHANMRAAGKLPPEAAPAPVAPMTPPPGGCPGSRAMALNRDGAGRVPGSNAKAISRPAPAPAEAPPSPSELRQWPVQIKLVPVNAPYLSGSHLLIAADCTAFALGDFHNRLMRGKITIIGCPKLDEGDYSEKLTAILRQNDIKSVTIARMEVPCCGGLSAAAVKALQNCGKMIPWQVVTISTDGYILED